MAGRHPPSRCTSCANDPVRRLAHSRSTVSEKQLGRCVFAHAAARHATRFSGCDKWNYVTWDTVTAWPTHHLWGRTADGNAFSSARQREPRVRFETDATPPQVHVFGGLGMDRTVQQPGILDTSHVFYRRTFTLVDRGLQISSELLSLGQDEVTELWETLPIYLNDAKQAKGRDTQIEFRIGGDWQPATTRPADGVTEIRAARIEGAVRIKFAAPQTVRLSEVTITRYQKQDRLQNIQIDLLGSDGRAVAMPQHATVTYTISPEAK